MMILIFFVILLVMIQKYNNSQKEIYRLKQQLLRYTNEIEVSNPIERNTEIETISVKNIDQETINSEKTKKIVKNKQTTNNMLILIAGAFLIVLATIIFLISSWNTIPNVIKTWILTLLIGVFLGTSYLADKKFHLALTSKTFYYIAMAYIPIVMLSISIFKLLGSYLSVLGDGKFIYFSICTAILSLLYLIEVIRYNRKILLFCSIITQILTVIFTILIFVKNLYIILFGLLLYTLIIYIISQYDILKNINLINIKYIAPILILLFSIITFALTFTHWIQSACTLIDVLNILVLIITYYFMKKNNKNIKFIIDIALLFIILTIINLEKCIFNWNIKFYIIALSTFLLYSFNYLKTHTSIYKIISYIALNILLLSIFLIFELKNYIKYITFITTLIVLLIEKISKSNSEKNYLIASFSLTFLSLNTDVNIISFICILITSISFIYYIKKEKLDQHLIIFPMIAIAPTLYATKIDLLHPFNLNIILSFILIGFTTIKSSLIKKSNNIYLFTSIIYIVFSIFSFKMNIFINLFLILVWSIIHSKFYEKNGIFKVISYITGLLIYNEFCSNLYALSCLTMLNCIGYLICLYLITRTVLKKYIQYYKCFEYIFTLLIFFFSFNHYLTISEIMYCIILLVICVIIGYIKKVGPLFIVSLVSIVVNMFKLTKNFWKSVPWWIYMLIIGSILISFAIRNEINENKNKVKFMSIIKKLKGKIDL